jgi:hypothetical protein
MQYNHYPTMGYNDIAEKMQDQGALDNANNYFKEQYPEMESMQAPPEFEKGTVGKLAANSALKGAGMGASIGEKISDIDGSSILSGASSLADDMGLKDSAKKKITFRQNPDKFFQEYCDDPRLDNDCMTVIKKPGKEDIYLEKLCDGDPVKSPDCEAKFMALHKENAKTKYITDVCEDAPTDKLKCRQYYKEVKGAEKFYIDLCADDKAKEPECNKEKLLAVDPSKKIFEKIYCADDEEKRDARCPKIVEEKEDEESDQEEPEEESEGESDEDSDEDF